MIHEGGCACGAIRFRTTAPALGTAACHCTDCQKAAGGGPNVIALIPRDALHLLTGTPRFFVKTGDSGAKARRAFCPDCGTPLWSDPADQPFLPVKLGAFDTPPVAAPGMHIYTRSAPSWHNIPDDVPQFPRMPPAG